MKQDKIYGFNFNRILTGRKRNCLPHPLPPLLKERGKKFMAKI